MVIVCFGSALMYDSRAIKTTSWRCKLKHSLYMSLSNHKVPVPFADQHVCWVMDLPSVMLIPAANCSLPFSDQYA